MAGLVSAIIISFLGFMIHFFIIGSGIIKINPEWCIKKLKRHAQLLMVIWLLCLPAFIYLFGLLRDTDIINKAAGDHDLILNYLYGIIIFACLFFVYLTFYYVVDRSVSSRLMIEIDRSRDKRMSFEDIKKVYDLETKYDNELNGMVEGGFMRKDGDYYYNTVKGRFVARCTDLYKRAFRLGKGG